MGLAILLGCVPVRGFKDLSVCFRRKKAKWCSKPKSCLENDSSLFIFPVVRGTGWGWTGTCSRLQWDSGRLEINQENTSLHAC